MGVINRRTYIFLTTFQKCKERRFIAAGNIIHLQSQIGPLSLVFGHLSFAKLCLYLLYWFMKFMKFILVIVALSIIISCHRGDNVSNEESNRVEIEIRQTLNDYFRDVNTNGPLAELKYLDSSKMFSWHPPGFTGPINYDSVKTILIENTIAGTRSTVSWDSLEINPESQDKAKYTGKIMAITNGDTIHLKEEGNLIKRKDGWKLLSGKTVISNQ